VLLMEVMQDWVTAILIVVEADEFDRTFLKLNPVIAVLTSLETEHLDTYKDLDDIKTALSSMLIKYLFTDLLLSVLMIWN
jgi:UDP-N-acetylmuramate-alanine ligase